MKRWTTLLSVSLALVLAACAGEPSRDWYGYVEGECLYIAPLAAGALETLAVDAGQRVAAGQDLFVLEADRERAALRQAEEQVRQAESRLADLGKGQRPSELASLRARLAEAKAAAGLSRAEAARREELHAKGVLALEELDQARTAAAADTARVRDLEAQLATARLGGREDALKAAEAEAAASRAVLDQARWSLDQKRRAAPEAGLVFDVFRRPGEVVPAGGAVLALLPPARVVVRFFVPEPAKAGLAVGAPVTVSGDSLPAFAARVSYVSPKAEFAPPVIYSAQNRAKLVYMVEARTDAQTAAGLHPGQPVEVRPGAPEDRGGRP
ncbi:MAG: HlyD family efflux transporter periplasmic adaptor subunit [Thermodesulfobacteriota bacterium]